MLKKKTWILFLGLVVFASSACVTPTHASSAPSVIITHVQAGGTAGAKVEFVVLHNNTALEVIVSDWCLVNSVPVTFACIEQADTEQSVLPPYASALIASTGFVQASGFPADYFTQVYTVTNQLSGSLVGSADTISLLNAEEERIDSYSWTAPLANGKVAQRVALPGMPPMYTATGAETDWFVGVLPPIPINAVERRVVIPETPEEPELPTEPEEPPLPGEGTLLPQSPFITEIFPNPKGSDVGNEFIELYNPNDVAVPLANFRLRVGPALDKEFTFPIGTVLPPLSYTLFTNATIRFTLVNSTSKVALFKDQVLVGEAVGYEAPPEGESWAYFEGIGWRYTAVPSPAAPNGVLPSEVIEEALITPVAAALKPCAANQYRSLETNRCRLITTASTATAPAPCKTGQERNPETNRCRTVAQAAKQTPCKEGQERSAETNRCRTVKAMPAAGYAIDAEATRSAEQGVAWYYWAAIGGIIACIIAYGAWEWRQEVRQWAKTVRQRFAHRVD